MLRSPIAGNPAAARGACALLRQLANADALKAAILAADGLTLLQSMVSEHLQSSGKLPMSSAFSLCPTNVAAGRFPKKIMRTMGFGVLESL